MVRKKKANVSVRPNGRNIPFGEKAADALSKWAGSWTFIIGFLVFLGIWMAFNVYAWVGEWDPYPFILLNLVLSCIAALQAPVILMSQNRQTKKDRAKMRYDYDIDRKSEKMVEEILEILKNKKKSSKK